MGIINGLVDVEFFNFDFQKSHLVDFTWQTKYSLC